MDMGKRTGEYPESTARVVWNGHWKHRESTPADSELLPQPANGGEERSNPGAALREEKVSTASHVGKGWLKKPMPLGEREDKLT